MVMTGRAWTIHRKRTRKAFDPRYRGIGIRIEDDVLVTERRTSGAFGARAQDDRGESKALWWPRIRRVTAQSEREMMLRKPTIACFAALLISLTAHGQTPQTSMKGYELYSWKT